MRITKSKFERLFREELSKAQQKLDLDDDGEIEGSDLSGLRSGKDDEDVGEEKKEKVDERIVRLVQEEYSKILSEDVSLDEEFDAGLGAHRPPDEAYQSLIQNLEGASKDLELLGVHLQGAKSTTEDVDSQLKTLQQLTNYVTEVTWPDIKAIAK